MEKKNSPKKGKSSEKYKSKTPLNIMRRILRNFKEKNLYKKPSFWLTNIFFIYFLIKAFQTSLYLNQMSVSIPREVAINNLMYLDSNAIKGMKTEVLIKYLDELEKQKNERKDNKQI